MVHYSIQRTSFSHSCNSKWLQCFHGVRVAWARAFVPKPLREKACWMDAFALLRFANSWCSKSSSNLLACLGHGCNKWLLSLQANCNDAMNAPSKSSCKVPLQNCVQSKTQGSACTSLDISIANESTSMGILSTTE